MVEYNQYQGTIFGGPGKGKTGSISMDISNNIEMKIKSDDDSTGFKKISIIDELGASMSYNMAADVRPWSDLSTRLRLKLSKSYTFTLNAVFATYIGTRTEYSYGRFGRFQGMSQNLHYTLDNKKVANFFKWLRGEKVKKDDKGKNNKNNGYDTGVDTNIDDQMEAGKHGARKEDAGMAETDDDGYMAFNVPWSTRCAILISSHKT